MLQLLHSVYSSLVLYPIKVANVAWYLFYSCSLFSSQYATIIGLLSANVFASSEKD